MAPSLKNFVFTKTNFDDFYNILCEIEERATSWVDQDYAEEQAERKYQFYLKEQYKLKLKNKEYFKNRELDLRRKLLTRIGEYEPEEGEIFE